ncbi:DUF1833 family protein [Ralstonia insidiosa]|uniref:DUF1833 family protein n=1 Tax=Ralstonia insidiosa TaxID=190721 RepID=A0A848NNQ9_9RALS|nr:DUF1833 family protein [Ralstonia insidiosa]NMV36772.1 DUF1833 family protein [Ralstonia insidiosa]
MVTLYSQALKEAYAANPSNDIVLNTLEIRHPAFVDAGGSPTAIRVVQGYEDIVATLEASAPLDAGKPVTFVAGAFNFTLPGFKEGEVPQLQITIDNVSQEVTAHLEQAIGQVAPIEVTYRPYLMSDLSGPQMDPPFNMLLTNVKAELFQVTGTATLNDVHNWGFPGGANGVYTLTRFPGLLR